MQIFPHILCKIILAECCSLYGRCIIRISHHNDIQTIHFFIVSTLTMGSLVSRERPAENDRQLKSAVLKCAQNPAGHGSGKIVGLTLDQMSRFNYCWKPVLGPYNFEVLPYPNNTEFWRRIPYSAWVQFNADLSIAHYNGTLSFLSTLPLWPVLVLPAVMLVCRGRCVFVKDVIDHYTKHLFHPLLIDVQLFSEFLSSGSEGESEELLYIGFFITNSSAELFRLPQPEQNRSSGYTSDLGETKYSRATVPDAFPQHTAVPPPFYPEAPALAMQGDQKSVSGGCDSCGCCCVYTRPGQYASVNISELSRGPIVACELSLPAGFSVQGSQPYVDRTPSTAPGVSGVQLVPLSSAAIERGPVEASAPAEAMEVSYALPAPRDGAQAQGAGSVYQPGQVVSVN